MKVKGIAGRDARWLSQELARGGRFLVFDYTFAAGVVTCRRNSSILFVRAGRKALRARLGWSLLSALLGWFGPGGRRETLDVLRLNWRGGTDVTADLLRLSRDKAEAA
jgi:hypothetical protein